jgi:hypothetical protein
MVDRSPHQDQRRRGRRGRHDLPDQRVDRPPRTSAAMMLYTDVTERRCWRCLQTSSDHLTRETSLTPGGWLCEPCERILFAAELRAA